MTVVVIVETVVIALLGLLVCGLLRSHAEILRKLRELTGDVPSASGSARPSPPAPVRPESRAAVDVVGTTVDDEVVKIGVANARHDTLLAFLSTGCVTCTEFWSAFAQSRRLRVPGGARLVVVTKGPAEESPSRLRELAPKDVPVVMSTDAWADYDVPVAPYFVYVDGRSGSVVSGGAAQSWDQVVSRWSTALAAARGE